MAWETKDTFRSRIWRSRQNCTDMTHLVLECSLQRMHHLELGQSYSERISTTWHSLMDKWNKLRKHCQELILCGNSFYFIFSISYAYMQICFQGINFYSFSYSVWYCSTIWATAMTHNAYILHAPLTTEWLDCNQSWMHLGGHLHLALLFMAW